MIQFEKVEDLFTMAQKIENGAAKQYLESAEKARQENPEIAALFQRLAEEEQEHESKVLELADEASVDLSNASIEEENTTSNNNQTSVQNDSLYEILAAAVRREERAFEVYSEIAANNDNEDVCLYAEKLAKEELGHAALLRAIRRRVYHEHKILLKTQLLPTADKIKTLEEFLVNAYIIEKAIAIYLDKIDDSGSFIHPCKEHSEFVIEQIVENINESFSKLDELSNRLLSDVVIFTLDKLLSECESIYEYYDSFILNSDNEEVMQKAVHFTSEMLTKINLLQKIKKAR